jgi:hypothetical protein
MRKPLDLIFFHVKMKVGGTKKMSTVHHLNAESPKWTKVCRGSWVVRLGELRATVVSLPTNVGRGVEWAWEVESGAASGEFGVSSTRSSALNSVRFADRAARARNATT